MTHTTFPQLHFSLPNQGGSSSHQGHCSILLNGPFAGSSSVPVIILFSGMHFSKKIDLITPLLKKLISFTAIRISILTLDWGLVREDCWQCLFFNTWLLISDLHSLCDNTSSCTLMNSTTFLIYVRLP